MYNITLIKGDGIGPEIADAVLRIIKAAGVEINWDIQTAGADVIEKEGVPLPQRVIDSVKKNKIALRTPVTTPIRKGFRSVNVQLRKDLDLYANLRPCYNLPNIKTRYDNVDIVVVRENTEDLYAGIEKQIDHDTAESIKRITRSASERIAKFAFDYAVKNNRKFVTVVTKANICKLSDKNAHAAPEAAGQDDQQRADIAPGLFHSASSSVRCFVSAAHPTTNRCLSKVFFGKSGGKGIA